MLGRVVRASGLQHLVVVNGEEWLCEVRGRLKGTRREAQSPVVAGDRVEIEPTGPGSGVIERVLPRRSQFARAASGFRPYQQIVAANLDQLVVVVAVRQPEPRPGFIDRALVMAQRGSLVPVVCLNKMDLDEGGEAEAIAEVYAGLGYRVCLTSARTGAGIEALREALTGKDSVIVGHSGVGKSSLLNRLEPGLSLKTDGLMRQHERGRHTTTCVRLYPLNGGGHAVDTPGIKELRLWSVAPEELVGYFAEMRELVDGCRFRDCTHLHEPGCAVLAAVATGRIARIRHEGYARIRQSL
jgi:ribosome biogenesis GTPase